MSVAAQVGPSVARRKCCGSCACRTTTATEASDDVMDLAFTGGEFFCHTGMRPELAMNCSSWDERRDGTPVKADGSPAELCAGWWAYRRAVLRDLTPRAK